MGRMPCMLLFILLLLKMKNYRFLIPDRTSCTSSDGRVYELTQSNTRGLILSKANINQEADCIYIYIYIFIYIKIRDDVITWKHFPRYWSFVWGIHRSPLNSSNIGQWRGDLMFSLIYVWINGWVNNREADDLRCYRAHYDVTVMLCRLFLPCDQQTHDCLP